MAKYVVIDIEDDVICDDDGDTEFDTYEDAAATAKEYITINPQQTARILKVVAVSAAEVTFRDVE